MKELPQVDLSDPNLVQSSCEFCGRRYYADPVDCRLMHDHPACPEFLALDVIAFMVENNKIKLARRDGNGDN